MGLKVDSARYHLVEKKDSVKNVNNSQNIILFEPKQTPNIDIIKTSFKVVGWVKPNNKKLCKVRLYVPF